MPLIRNKPDPAGPKEAIPDNLAGELASDSADRRWAAARAAGADPSTVPALGEALAREKSERVREAIFSALARISTPESLDVILTCLRSDDAALRTAAMDSLRLVSRQAAPVLFGLLKDPDPDVRLLVCDLMRDLRNDNAIRALCTLIETENEPNVCGAAVEVLAEIGDGTALQSLSRCAARFPDNSFLAFAIEAAAARIGAAPSRV